MPRDFLHNHPQFADLIRIVAEEKGIDPALVELVKAASKLIECALSLHPGNGCCRDIFVEEFGKARESPLCPGSDQIPHRSGMT